MLIAIANFFDFRFDGYRSQSRSFNRKELLIAFSDLRWWGPPYKFFCDFKRTNVCFLLKSVYYNNARRIGKFEIDRKELIKEYPNHAIATGRIASEVCEWIN